MLHDMHAFVLLSCLPHQKQGFADHMHATGDVIDITCLVVICESRANRDREFKLFDIIFVC